MLPAHVENHVWSSFGLDMGSSHTFGNGTKIAGACPSRVSIFPNGGETDAIARFEGDSTEVDPMSVELESTDLMGFGSIGIDWVHQSNATLGVEYSTIMDSGSSLRRWNFRARILSRVG